MFGRLGMNKRRYKLKNRTRFFSLIFFISLIVFIIAYTASVSGYSEPEYVIITVQPGDSLWSIAQKYCDNSCDIRELIYKIKKINNMDSSLLVANTSIIVPVND